MVAALFIVLACRVSDVVPLQSVLPYTESRAEGARIARKTTAHYDVCVAAPEALGDGSAEKQAAEERADELARILEAAWPVFQDFFQAEPRLPKGTRLAVELYATRAAWQAGILADKIGQPAGADRSWFSNKTRKVYVYQNPIDYVTRAHALYGACLQFHALAKAKNLDLARDWYVHGIAEMFSVHTWHAGTLELAVDRRVCTIDLPALAEHDVKGFARPWIEERLALPAVRWAAVRFARDLYRDRFDKLALGTTGSKMSGDVFMRSLGPEAQIGKEFCDWIARVQMPLEVLSWSFQELADGRFVGRPARDGIASCCLKAPASAFEALIPVGPDQRGSGALVLTWNPPLEIEIARFTERELFLERYVDGQLASRESMPVPRATGSRIRARAVRDGELVRILAGDAVLHEMPIAEPRFGLAALAEEVVFEGVSWE